MQSVIMDVTRHFFNFFLLIVLLFCGGIFQEMYITMPSFWSWEILKIHHNRIINLYWTEYIYTIYLTTITASLTLFQWMELSFNLFGFPMVLQSLLSSGELFRQSGDNYQLKQSRHFPWFCDPPFDQGATWKLCLPSWVIYCKSYLLTQFHDWLPCNF